MRLLAPTGATVDVSKPIRNGACGAPAPVLLRRVAHADVVPPALVNCRVAAKIDEWVKTIVQPGARELLGAPIGRLITASGYSCRQRIGTSSERLSEHSFANALDIAAFVTTDGRTVDVLSQWGQTARDRQAQAHYGERGKPAGGDARPMRDTEGLPQNVSLEARFLRRMHEGACGLFGTVLGPEANEAHRSHLHLDLAQRKRSAYCE